MPLLRALSRIDLDEATRSRLSAMREAIDVSSTDALVAVLQSESASFVREAALTHLARLDSAFSAQALIALLRGGDTALRNAAIETLGCLGERALDALAGVLSDADPDLRIYALTALERIECPRAAELALDTALKDEDVNVCAAALDVVSQSGAREMAAALDIVAARFSDHPFLAFAARAAQCRLG